MQQTITKPTLKVFQGARTEVHDALHTIALHAIEEEVLVIDADSSFQLHEIMQGLPEKGSQVLQNMKVAHPTSVLQFVTLLDQLDLEVTLSNASTVIITNLNTPFLCLKNDEVKTILPVVCAKLKQIRQSGISVYVGCIDQEHCLYSSQEVQIRQILRNHLRTIVPL